MTLALFRKQRELTAEEYEKVEKLIEEGHSLAYLMDYLKTKRVSRNLSMKHIEYFRELKRLNESEKESNE